MTELLLTCSRVSKSLCSITRCSNESRSRGIEAAVRAAKVRSASSSDACSEVIWSLKLRVAFLLSSERKTGKHCQTVPLDKGHYNPNSFTWQLQQTSTAISLRVMKNKSTGRSHYMLGTHF